MAIIQYWIGTHGPFEYEDTDPEYDYPEQMARKQDVADGITVLSNSVETETSYGQSATPGTSDDASRSDHTHGTPAYPTRFPLTGDHYSQFESDGTLKFNGDATVWDDIQFAISSGKVPAANFPDLDTFTTNTKEYNFDVGDYIDIQAAEINHWWKEGTVVVPHLHITLGVSNASGSNRYAKYTVYIAYADTEAVWVETSFTAELTIPTGSSAMLNTKLSLGNWDLVGKHIGAQMKARVQRIAATGGTEYPNHTFITQLGIHAEKDTEGSRGTTTK